MTDTELIDAMADLRIVDGIGGVDIDEETSIALGPSEAAFNDESLWKMEWRRQFRIAVESWIKSEQETEAQS